MLHDTEMGRRMTWSEAKTRTTQDGHKLIDAVLTSLVEAPRYCRVCIFDNHEVILGK